MIRSSGFTLVELMIVVVIISILAAIGYPAYQSQVEKGHLSEGHAILTEVASQLERCYSRFGTYDDSDNDDITCNYKTESENGTYDISVTFPDDSPGFTATAQRVEAKRLNECGDLTLTHTGQKGIENADSGVTVDDCW
jgi:type IV pilus assembly protein PilE